MGDLFILSKKWCIHGFGGRMNILLTFMTEAVHIETSPLIYRANQWTGFYMVPASVMKELSKFTTSQWNKYWKGHTHKKHLRWSFLQKDYLSDCKFKHSKFQFSVDYALGYNFP